jgi:hypothetical protein
MLIFSMFLFSCESKEDPSPIMGKLPQESIIAVSADMTKPVITILQRSWSQMTKDNPNRDLNSPLYNGNISELGFDLSRPMSFAFLGRKGGILHIPVVNKNQTQKTIDTLTTSFQELGIRFPGATDHRITDTQFSWAFAFRKQEVTVADIEKGDVLAESTYFQRATSELDIGAAFNMYVQATDDVPPAIRNAIALDSPVAIGIDLKEGVLDTRMAQVIGEKHPLNGIKVSNNSDSLSKKLYGPAPMVLKTNVNFVSIWNKYSATKVFAAVRMFERMADFNIEEKILKNLNGPLVFAVIPKTMKPKTSKSSFPVTPILYIKLKKKDEIHSLVERMCGGNQEEARPLVNGLCQEREIQFGIWKNHFVMTATGVEMDSLLGDGLFSTKQEKGYNKPSLLTIAADIPEVVRMVSLVPELQRGAGRLGTVMLGETINYVMFTEGQTEITHFHLKDNLLYSDSEF